MQPFSLVHGDCLAAMRTMPGQCVDLVFCSPPYEAARTYGIDFNLAGQPYVDWCAERFVECLRVCRGLVAWVIEGRTARFHYSAVPILLMADLHRRGVKLRKPPVFNRQGIPGSGGPDWLPACGMVETSTVFSYVTNPPGSGGVKTLTIGGYFDGVRKLLRGCAGNAVFNLNFGEEIRIDWTFMGIWSAPTDVALLTPTLPTTAPLSFVSAGFTRASYAHKFGTATLDLGNKLSMREDANDPSGYAHALITGRTPIFKFDPEATLIATNDPYGDWLGHSEGALAFSIGSSGNRVAFAAPKAQISRIDETDRGGIDANDLEMQLNSNAANDNELTITID